MFTGIIENTGIIQEVISNGTNKTFWVTSPLANELKVDQRLSHNGVCLTIEEIKGDIHRITAIEETLLKTNLGAWQLGSIVNLERCMQLNGRLDGHIVQGHVDGMAKLARIEGGEGSWRLEFDLPQSLARYCVEKGSIALNGVSLTINGLAAIDAATARIAITLIPHTWGHTTFPTLTPGDAVNVEVDVIAKYEERLCQPLIKP